MCADPITILGIAATAVGTYSSFQEAQARRKSMRAQADARAEEGRDAELRGIEAAEDRREKAALLFADQRAASAANNNVFDGSVKRLALDDYEAGVDDALQERENASREADGFYRRAAIADAEADNINPVFSAGTTLAGGIYDVSSDFDWMREESTAFEPADYSVG
ncbi:MAG: hypothetical protein AAF661_05015 [Pseudomonadota bacterium]